MRLKKIFHLFTVGLLLACSDGDDTDIPTFTYTFEENTSNWSAGFSDYPAEWDESRFEFVAERRQLPPSVNEDGYAFYVSGRNISDDLFMFIKREITGLQPETTYHLTFQIELASQYPEESVGIGGSPGGSVYLKAGGSTEKPDKVTQDGDIRMNIDKGGQSQGGENMAVLGNIGIPGSEEEYQLISRDNSANPIAVRTDEEGSLWIIVGTDSGFEGVTALYYNRIVVRLEN